MPLAMPVTIVKDSEVDRQTGIYIIQGLIFQSEVYYLKYLSIWYEYSPAPIIH